MSTAVLISGQLRTFARCWPTQRWHVLRHFEDPHFFITVQAQGDEWVTLNPLIQEFGESRVHLDLCTDPDLSAHLTPELTRAYHQAPYANAAPAHQLLLQHWYQAECWKFYKRTVSVLAGVKSEFEKKFDTIIRLRADLWFHSFDERFSNYVLQSDECHLPWWGRFGGVNDRFAIMGPQAAAVYFTLYERIPDFLKSGCPFHPETLLKAALEAGGISYYEDLKTEFSTLRQNGEQRWPEITSIDLAHAALRAI